PRVDVAEVELLLQPLGDPRRGTGDLPRDKCLTTPRRFVVEQDAVAGEQIVGLAVVDRLPKRSDLRTGVGTSRIERREFRLRCLPDVAIHFAAGGLVDAHLFT